MSATRTYSGIATTGFSLGRETLKIANIEGTATAGNTNSNDFVGFYTTTIASSSTSVLGLATAPTNGQAPVFEFQVTKATPFNPVISAGLPQIPGPLYMGLSSTAGSYTATTDTVDIFIEMEEWEEELVNAASTATVASGNALTVWTDTIAAPSAAKGLIDVIALDLNNSSGAQLYLQLFAGASPVAGDIPKMGWSWKIPIAGSAGNNINLNGAILLNLGDPSVGGLTPLQQGKGTLGTGTTTGVNYSGCYFRVSTTPNLLTLAGASAAMIVARYVTPTN